MHERVCARCERALPCVHTDLPHASMTNGSFTDTHAMVSTPCARQGQRVSARADMLVAAPRRTAAANGPDARHNCNRGGSVRATAGGAVRALAISSSARSTKPGRCFKLRAARAGRARQCVLRMRAPRCAKTLLAGSRSVGASEQAPLRARHAPAGGRERARHRKQDHLRACGARAARVRPRSGRRTARFNPSHEGAPRARCGAGNAPSCRCTAPCCQSSASAPPCQSRTALRPESGHTGAWGTIHSGSMPHFGSRRAAPARRGAAAGAAV
jgi:hypothetical protein